MRVLAGACAVGLAAALLTACSSGGEENGSGSKDAVASNRLKCDETTTVADLAGYPVPTAKKKYRVALLQVTRTGYYFQALAYSSEKAAKEAGIDLKIYAGQGFYSPANQLQQAEQAIREKVDGIILQPADYAGSAAVVAAADRAGIPIINVATEVKDENVDKVVQDDYAWGELMADEVSKAVGESGGDGVFMAGPATATWAVKRAEGFQSRLKKYSTFNLLGAPNTDLDPARGLAAFENTAKASDNVTWAASVYEAALLPAASIPPKYKGKTAYVAGSYEPSVIAGLKDGSIASAISTEPIGVARIGVAELVKKLNGEEIANIHCVAAAVFTAADVDSSIAQAELIPSTEE